MDTNATQENSQYDVGIAGGGLAGLSTAIMLGKAGHSVILFEKEHYPFHRVCGEYLSMESFSFLERLGLDPKSLDLPRISKLIVSSPNGNFLQSKLDVGGIGVSRYFLDNALKNIAVSKSVDVKEGARVKDIKFIEDHFQIELQNGSVRAQVVCGAFGKRSNLDIKWGREFAVQKPNKLNNFVGVKYHVKIGFPIDTIALHNFKGGYCGISKIEDDLYCLCYLTTAQNFVDNNNSISATEENVLCRNPFLKEIFSDADFQFREPVTISQISFDKKSQVEDHILFVGDAAGMIAPLCGNGMSIAFHSAKLAAAQVDQFLCKKISRKKMEANYQADWDTNFKNRLKDGRRLQKLFGKDKITNTAIASLKHFPGLTQALVKATHGNEF